MPTVCMSLVMHSTSSSRGLSVCVWHSRGGVTEPRRTKVASGRQVGPMAHSWKAGNRHTSMQAHTVARATAVQHPGRSTPAPQKQNKQQQCMPAAAAHPSSVRSTSTSSSAPPQGAAGYRCGSPSQ